MESVRDIPIAVYGVGNCACALYQAIEYFRNVRRGTLAVPGLIYPEIGGYLPRHIRVAAAYDVNPRKIGKDVAHAIWARPNNAQCFIDDIPLSKAIVSPGFIGDGIAPHMKHRLPVYDQTEDYETCLARVVYELGASGAKMGICLLPTGSRKAVDFYAEASLRAGVAFINGIPERVATDPVWQRRFADAKIPCAGDDMMSQFGATYLTRLLVLGMVARGMKVLKVLQNNRGGNFDFLNLMDLVRIVTKLASKAFGIVRDGNLDQKRVWAGPTGYSPRLKDTKIADIEIWFEQLGGIEHRLKTRLAIEDSPNAAGVLLDMIRLMMLSLDRNLSGYQEWSGYYVKRPDEYQTLADSMRLVEGFMTPLKSATKHARSRARIPAIA